MAKNNKGNANSSATSADDKNDKKIELKSRYISFLLRRRTNITTWAVNSEQNLTGRVARKQSRVDRAIKRAEKRALARVERHAKSRLYKKSRFLYGALAPVFLIGRCAKYLFNAGYRKVVKARQQSPHRTFFVTDPSLARRSIKMSGYFGFTSEVMRLIWNNRGLFAKYILVFGAIVLLIVGGLSQHNLRELRDNLENNGVSGWNEWSALLSRAVVRASTAPDAGQQVLLGLMMFYGWLAVVWLCRKITNGETGLRLRDGLYNSGTALFGEIALVCVMVAQSVPLALSTIAYYVATAGQWINSGIRIENMAFWCALVAVAVLTFYWISATVLAMIITALPGMYPMQALKMAKELIAGRRASILMRLIIMLIPIVLLWLVLVIGAIFIDTTLNIQYIPIIPIITSILIPITLVWITSYTYLLYRNIIDDPTPPYSELPRRKFDWRSMPDVIRNIKLIKFICKLLNRMKRNKRSNNKSKVKE